MKENKVKENKVKENKVNCATETHVEIRRWYCLKVATYSLLLNVWFFQGHLGVAQEGPRNSLYDLNLTENSEFLITTNELKEEPFNTQLVIKTLGNSPRIIATYEGDDAFLYMRPSYPDGDRLLSVWEGGSHVKLAIFKLTNQESEKKSLLVFERQSPWEPDILDGGNTVVVYSGKSFVKGGYYPKTTETFDWDGQKYNLVKTEPWREHRLALRSSLSQK